jgi:hypothetical protein
MPTALACHTTDVAEALEAVLPLLDADPAAGHWLAAGVRRYLAAGGRLRLDQALGITGPSGSTPWWRKRQLAARDLLLFQLWRAHLASLDANAAARAIVGMHKIYVANAWTLDKHRYPPAMPDAYAGTPDVFLYQLMKLGVPIPAQRQLTNVLRKEMIKCI